MGRPGLRFTVLGPVRVWLDGEALPAGTPQQRAMLAALLLRRGRTATAQELVDALWGEQPPAHAVPTLRTYATRLRNALGPRAEVLASESGGYALRLRERDEVDVDVVESLAAEAEKAATAGELGHAHKLYGEALAMWDGDEALAGIPGPGAELHRNRLQEQRLAMAEQHLDLGLQIGLHAESVSELTALTTAHPLRERLRELLMLALYRCGRQAEALAVYADARRILVDELGIEPGPRLSELQQRILNADESLHHTARPATSTLGAPPPVRPAQLPATVPDFTGRRAFVAELGAELANADGRVMAVSAVAGIGGVGKTTLAVRVAHAAREHFPDGQLYVDLQGAGPTPADPEAVLASFLRALGTAEEAIPKGLHDRAALYRSLLDGRRVLTLLDNARDAAQVRPLLPGTPGCATLITSRHRMVDLAGAHLVDLDVMSPEEALTLFTRIVGEERVAAERQAAMDVVAACGFLPLAIRIAASRLASRRTWTVATLADKLSDERRRLDELKLGDQAVKATFELGYGQLEPEQARAFRLLGVAEGPDFSLAAAAALLDLPVEEAEELLESLVDTTLLESAAPGRYRFHDLVRLFARACAERDEQTPGECEAALRRLLDFYLATAKTAYALERPGDRTVAHLAPTHHPGLPFTERRAALDWLFTEADCLLACVRQCATGDTLPMAADLILAATDLDESGAFSGQYKQTAAVVLERASEAGATVAEGRVRMALTYTAILGGTLEEANGHATRAYQLGESVDDPLVMAEAQNELGIIAHHQGDFEAALAHWERALAVFRTDGNHSGEASAMSNLSRAQLALGNSDEAVRLVEEAVELYRSLGSTLRKANARYQLGYVTAQRGELETALEEFREALAVFQDKRQRFWEGMTYYRMAEVHLAQGLAAEAATVAELALRNLRVIGGARRRAQALTVLGRALHDTGQTDRARACWEQALDTLESENLAGAEEVRNLLNSSHV